jgi:hypothetical protein
VIQEWRRSGYVVSTERSRLVRDVTRYGECFGSGGAEFLDGVLRSF